MRIRSWAAAVVAVCALSLSSANAAITTTSSAPITASLVSSFGFDTDPTVLSGTTNGDTTFSNVVVNGAFPNQFGAIDVCVTGGATCQGGTGTGVLIGQTYTVDLLTLTFSSTFNQLVVTNFGVRYQSIEPTTA